MLAEALVAIAAAGGTAVVEAAGTDAWRSVRERVARLLGRNAPERERAELERLDQTAAALDAADPGQEAALRTRQEASWQTRFELLLEDADDAEREQLVNELRGLVDETAQARSSAVSGNTFHGPTAFQVGDHNRQDNRFGPEK
ncbi:hypothetical protein SAMN05216188_1378 [Lentzea xinjiangensis]|uniref:Uncharacterized protein n=1 Tax=Lentzea xinjiangensis TaxID=402600 RepID=A0A1H9WM34_9PSEU|nr:hypothetical protein [Lentzea xinjiangensis]SES34958.1 hypothetical protein SAMN05216188_1378 [Lentzea xinjiangensis]